MTLVAHWPLDDDSGDATDVTGNGNDGTVNGPTQGVSGPLTTTAYSFDGSSDHVSCGTIQPDNITLSAWVNGDNWLSTEGRIAIIDNGAHTSNGYGMFLGTNNLLTIINGMQDETSQVPIGSWIHVAATYNTNGDLIHYLNGTLAGSINTGNGTISYGSRNTILGAAAWNTNKSNFEGQMSDVRLYDRALTPQEVQYLYSVAQEGRYVSPKKVM
jgi:hypothetical protein